MPDDDTDTRRGQPLLDYANPPSVRVAPGEIILGIVSLLCGIILLLLAAVVAVFSLRSHASLLDIFFPIIVMAGAGGAGCFIGIRALRRWRRERGG